MAEKKEIRKIALVRIRGRVEIRGKIQDTLVMLGLKRVNWVAVVDDNPVYKGMIQKAKDYITWGEMDATLFEQLVEKWGRKAGDARVEKKEVASFAKSFMAGDTTFKEAGIKPVFGLHPPSTGHKKGGIRLHVKVGGALGYRGKEINSLIARMAGLEDGEKK